MLNPNWDWGDLARLSPSWKQGWTVILEGSAESILEGGSDCWAVILEGDSLPFIRCS